MDNPSLFSLGRCQNIPQREHFLSKFLVELGRSTYITPSRPRIWSYKQIGQSDLGGALHPLIHSAKIGIQE